MKKKYALTILPAAAVAAAVLAQGPLAPPGAPVPAMKTLDQIEPRTPISNLPVTVSQSGSYYLTGNLQFTAPSGHAITIAADEVTLDLMGFKLSSSNIVTGDAIHINGGHRNITVKNGAIAGNSTVTISGTAPNRAWTVSPAGFNRGVTAAPTPEAKDCLFSGLHISRCRLDGLFGGEQAIAEKVTATENGGSGINLSFGGNLTGCTTRLNGDHGIEAGYCLLANCVATYNGGPGGIAASYGAVTNCLASFNRAYGISAFYASVANSIASHNDGTGIGAGTVCNCHAYSNGSDGISSSNGGSITNSIAISNEGTGILSSFSGSITHCMARFNGDDGISAPSGVIAFSGAASNNKNDNGSTLTRSSYVA